MQILSDLLLSEVVLSCTFAKSCSFAQRRRREIETQLRHVRRTPFTPWPHPGRFRASSLPPDWSRRDCRPTGDVPSRFRARTLGHHVAARRRLDRPITSDSSRKRLVGGPWFTQYEPVRRQRRTRSRSRWRGPAEGCSAPANVTFRCSEHTWRGLPSVPRSLPGGDTAALPPTRGQSFLYVKWCTLQQW